MRFVIPPEDFYFSVGKEMLKGNGIMIKLCVNIWFVVTCVFVGRRVCL